MVLIHISYHALRVCHTPQIWCVCYYCDGNKQPRIAMSIIIFSLLACVMCSVITGCMFEKCNVSMVVRVLSRGVCLSFLVLPLYYLDLSLTLNTLVVVGGVVLHIVFVTAGSVFIGEDYPSWGVLWFAGAFERRLSFTCAVGAFSV